ncbi:hypothetical protein PQX77_019907 [Marasmius sp. AFHP31]|nr:hypothetical protein PQX77_019907 [Marasmius sp. AFHP31]
MTDFAFEFPRRVIVDDTDPRITYETGTWNFDALSFDTFGVFGWPYNETMKGTSSGSASFSFTFEGEYVQVKGGKDNRNIPRAANSTDPLNLLPKYSCEIDGSPVASVDYDTFTYFTTNLVLCEQAHLAKTRHTISMTISVDDPNTQVFWLDSIEYAPLEGASLTNQVLKVDSSDRSCIYHNDTGGWESLEGNFGALYNGTQMAGTTMSFKFNGTSVSLFGVNPNAINNSAFKGTTGSYYVDTGRPVPFDIPASRRLPFAPGDSNFTAWGNRCLFVRDSLDGSKEHEIVITYSGTGTGPTDQLQFLILDYLLVENGATQVNYQLSGPTKESTIEGKTIRAIVGGVVGIVMALIAVAGLIWFFMKKRKEEKESNHESLIATPFRDVVKVWTGEQKPGSRNLQNESATGSIITTSTRRPSTDNARLANFVRMKRAQREAVDTGAVREEDSGIRYRDMNTSPPPIVVGRLPPAYTLE